MPLTTKYTSKPLSIYQLWILSLIDKESPNSYKELHSLFEETVGEKTFSNFYTMTTRLREEGLINAKNFRLTRLGKTVFENQIRNCLSLAKHYAAR